jgi:hypothetical protein
MKGVSSDSRKGGRRNGTAVLTTRVENAPRQRTIARHPTLAVSLLVFSANALLNPIACGSSPEPAEDGRPALANSGTQCCPASCCGFGGTSDGSSGTGAIEDAPEDDGEDHDGPFDGIGGSETHDAESEAGDSAAASNDASAE